VKQNVEHALSVTVGVTLGDEEYRAQVASGGRNNNIQISRVVEEDLQGRRKKGRERAA